MSRNGFATLYVNDEPTFTSFIQYFVALPYLPLEELSDAVDVDEVPSWTFNPEISQKELERMERFKLYLVDYARNFCILEFLAT